MSTTIFTEIEKLDSFPPYANLSNNVNKVVAEKLLAKCGEVFLQQQQQHLFIFFCSMCDGNFCTVDLFANHIHEEHLMEHKNINGEPNSRTENELNYEEFLDDDVEEHFIDEEASIRIERISPTIQQHEQFLSIPDYDNDSSSTVTARIPDADNKSKMNCRHCSQDFDLVEHMRLHVCPSKAAELYQCSQCLKCFKRKSNLRTHEHSHQSVKPYACNQCSSTFSNKQNLVIHVRRHLGEKPFQCSHCKKTFVSSTERNSHERSHTGERPFVCELCGKGHVTSSQLLEHRKCHTDERRFKCDECDKCFRTRTHLRSHFTVVHANLPRNFCCSKCNASFKTALALKQHAKIHVKEKRYKCTLCGKAFAQHPGLYAHMKTHAKENEPQSKLKYAYKHGEHNEATTKL